MRGNGNDLRSTASWTGHALPVGLAIVAAVLAIFAANDDRWHAALDYRRAAVAGGDAWRLVTAHAMHLSTGHAVLDIAALLLVGWIFGADLTLRRQAVVCVAGIATIDAALWLLHPEVERYVGLSGVLHAWFAAGAVTWLLADRDDSHRRARRAWGAALMVGLVVKLYLESRQQAFWLGSASFAVVTPAHRWGAAAGAGCGLVSAVLRRARAGGVSRSR